MILDKKQSATGGHQRGTGLWMGWICVALRATSSSATRLASSSSRPFIFLVFSPSLPLHPSTTKGWLQASRSHTTPIQPAAFRRWHEKLARCLQCALTPLSPLVAAVPGEGGEGERVATGKLDFLIVTLRGQQSVGWAGKFWRDKLGFRAFGWFVNVMVLFFFFKRNMNLNIYR